MGSQLTMFVKIYTRIYVFRLSKHDKESFFRGETLSGLEKNLKDEKIKSIDEKSWSEYFVDKKKHLLTGDEIDVWDDNDSSDSKKFFKYD